jgi:hypothetical protein
MESANERIALTRSAFKSFERRITLRLYAVSVGIMLANAVMLHYWR